MNDPVSTFKLFGLTFNVGNMISVFVTSVVVFLLMFFLSRKLRLVPTGKQNALEMMADFTNNIVKGSLDKDTSRAFSLYAFVLFFFILISNQLGLFIQLTYNDVSYVKSPTADPIVTMTLALMTLMLAHFAGVSKFGFKGYFSNTYLKPFKVWLPLSIFEEFTNFLTLGLRLFGNIFAGEMLLSVIMNFAFSHGPITMVIAVPLTLIWQGFSVFLGSIQAFVFVTLTSVYISQKIEVEE
ncbi:F0F1 ATP synthase subunit A [Apilactobacillus xinyiensis]|uniref:ATP synthase subunit a n=1 Tax=Apilactobacillus xinyiensis TaxID=2841032 RepID=A0ABT0HZH1_9LACO|nr:F0F1 ATP synthase subunit A [Apilactobacillus xinyiensis]MCK8623975.1 F0F1 ATP synthase subunit A [Apilactobacillus xinyiensis]